MLDTSDSGSGTGFPKSNHYGTGVPLTVKVFVPGFQSRRFCSYTDKCQLWSECGDGRKEVDRGRTWGESGMGIRWRWPRKWICWRIEERWSSLQVCLVVDIFLKASFLHFILRRSNFLLSSLDTDNALVKLKLAYHPNVWSYWNISFRETLSDRGIIITCWGMTFSSKNERKLNMQTIHESSYIWTAEKDMNIWLIIAVIHKT